MYGVGTGLRLAVLVPTAGLSGALGPRAPRSSSSAPRATSSRCSRCAWSTLGEALGEGPDWRGFALPGLEGCGLSPLVPTPILGVLVSGWHVPILFLEEVGLGPQILVHHLLGTAAVTYWHAWLFNHARSSPHRNRAPRHSKTLTKARLRAVGA